MSYAGGACVKTIKKTILTSSGPVGRDQQSNVYITGHTASLKFIMKEHGTDEKPFFSIAAPMAAVPTHAFD
jgi:hypothetical protein